MDAIPRIFIVEDEAIVADDIRQTLTDLGYAIAGTARTGEAAVTLIGETRPDLVLMDIHLAGSMDGIDVAGEVHTSLEIPVIFLTAYADRALLSRARVTEPYGYLVKPYDERSLQSAIEIAIFKHRMEQRLKTSEATTRLMVDTTPDLLYLVSSEGKFLMVNSALAERAGAGTEDLVGTSAYEMVGRKILSPRMACWQLDLRGEKRQNFEEQLDDRWYDVTISTVYDNQGVPEKYAVSARNVTIRKQAEEQMRNNAEYFRSIIADASEIVVLLNPDGTFSQPSPSFRAALGYGDAEAMKNNFFDHLALSDWQQARQVFSEVLIHPGMAKPLRVKFERNDGTVRSIRGIISNLSDNPFVGKIVMNGWAE
jgi:PAS domain S-box-containing protein